MCHWDHPQLTMSIDFLQATVRVQAPTVLYMPLMVADRFQIDRHESVCVQRACCRIRRMENEQCLISKLHCRKTKPSTKKHCRRFWARCVPNRVERCCGCSALNYWCCVYPVSYNNDSPNKTFHDVQGVSHINDFMCLPEEEIQWV
ncbi:hypothetical protein AVEN_81685-1 [Araneus ventricosus]|uniref:Uncharacterized protein n=1 Tax=Araneus ventricosus TaxID=182803 RepID=A0A4Y2MPA7_ARAVE|nr:hypothetical protein AVEN_93709-1 [Araneus ventricosus]GBN29868.1 hypothetical protein AVEN_81685-1 [Araneus ventricosus]